MFYNTTHLHGKELLHATNKANSQKEKVFAFFKLNPDKEFTPADVHQAIFDEATPITSTRRSITDLTKMGFLKQTSTKREGFYGASNYCWMLAGVGQRNDL